MYATGVLSQTWCNGYTGIAQDTPIAKLHVGDVENATAGAPGLAPRIAIHPYSNTGGPYILYGCTVSGSDDRLLLFYGNNSGTPLTGIKHTGAFSIGKVCRGNSALNLSAPSDNVRSATIEFNICNANAGYGNYANLNVCSFVNFYQQTAYYHTDIIMSLCYFSGGAWGTCEVYRTDAGGKTKFCQDLSSAGDITAYSSDCRLKCNVLTITCAVDRIKSLRGVEFEWDLDYIKKCNIHFYPSEKGKTIGFLAQELENTVPTAVREAPFESGLCRTVSWAEKYKTIKAEKIIPLLVEATKEQQSTIEKQQRQIDRLTCQVELLLRKCA